MAVNVFQGNTEKDVIAHERVTFITQDMGWGAGGSTAQEGLNQVCGGGSRALMEARAPCIHHVHSLGQTCCACISS